MKQEGSPGSFAYELLSASGKITDRLEAALDPLGLSLAKFGALSKMVAAKEPLPLSTLAERCACVRSNITQLVDRLEADGLVTRADDPHDRRSILAGLTDEGRRKQAAGARAIEKVERDLLASLPQASQDSLLQLLRSLHLPS